VEAADYATITTTARVLRRNVDLRDRVSTLISHLSRTESVTKYDGNFPVCRLLKVLGSLDVSIDCDLNVKHEKYPEMNLWQTSNTTMGHQVRDWLRCRNWRNLGDRVRRGQRADLPEIDAVDMDATTELARKESGEAKRTLEMILTGAIKTFDHLWRVQEPVARDMSAPTAPTCPFCSKGQVEDLVHIYWECESWRLRRVKTLELLSKMQIRRDQLHPMTQKLGVMEEDERLISWRKAVTQEWNFDAAKQMRPTLDEDNKDSLGRYVIYTDGSCRRQGEARFRAAGCGVFFAAHAINSSFVLPGITQSSEKAEARAALHAMETATHYGFDCHVKFDNEAMVGLAERVLSNHGGIPEDGQLIWTRMRQTDRCRKQQGGQGHAVSWIPGHTTKADVGSGVITMVDHVGNSYADLLAGRAAEKKACPTSLVEAAEERRAITHTVQRMMLEIIQSRREAIDKLVMENRRRDTEEIDLWESEELQSLPFGVQRKRRPLLPHRPTTAELLRREISAKCTHPTVAWEAETLRNHSRLPLTLEVPREWCFPRLWAPPLCWYWENLSWCTNDLGSTGVTWIELYIDFAAATGTSFCGDEGKPLSLAVAARRFAESSQALATANQVALWPGEIGLATSLAAFNFPRVHGLQIRPRLLRGNTVGRILVEIGGVDLSKVSTTAFDGLLSEMAPIWRHFTHLVGHSFKAS
jgi:ribonuclease HI